MRLASFRRPSLGSGGVAEEEAKKAIAGGAQLEDVVNVPARTDLMRGRFEKGYDERINELVTEMGQQIAASMEAN